MATDENVYAADEIFTEESGADLLEATLTGSVGYDHDSLITTSAVGTGSGLSLTYPAPGGYTTTLKPKTNPEKTTLSRRLAIKYAQIVNFGRKLIHDPDLPEWGEVSTYVRKHPTKVDDFAAKKITDSTLRPNLISSKIRPNMHAPVLDIDFPVSIVPSQTPGHYHLFFDKVMEEAEYFAFLEAMKEFGIIEEGYADASVARGASFVRIIDDEVGSHPFGTTVPW